MKKILKIALFILVSVVVIGAIALLVADEPVPEGTSGKKAEDITATMLRALNKAAWDTTYGVRWSFPGRHDYLWDRKKNLVQVTWKDYEVIFRTTNKDGIAFKGDQRLQGPEKEETIKTAWEYFANDSFWLIAPYKITDPGTERYYVNYEGNNALLVEYTSGGVTPGDRYLWILSETGLPKAWKMWVDIVPVGGMEFTWENWETFDTGARVALTHKGLLDIEIEKVEMASAVEDLISGPSPFKKFEEQ